MINRTAPSTAEQIDYLLMDYATGALDEAMALFVASYISVCPQARHHAQKLEIMGGILMESCCDPVSMNEKSLGYVLKRLDEKTQKQNAPVKQDVPENDYLPRPVRQHMNVQRTQKHKWKRAISGIKVMDVPVEKSCKTYARIFKIKPGKTIPEHTHRGLEFTLVLNGAVIEGEQIFKAGELIVHDHSAQHQPSSCPEMGCVCLVATDAPIRFTRGFMRLFNPFMR